MAIHAPITGAPTCAPSKTTPRFPAPAGSLADTAQTTRRDLLCVAGAATALGAAVATGAVALASEAIAAPIASPTPFAVAEAQYRAAHVRFNALPADIETADPDAYEREAERLGEASSIVDNAPVADLREFAMAFLAAHDDGGSLPWPSTVMKLVADAKRLTGAA